MDEKQQQKLERSLKSRHVTMIAIGGAIGTGLFLGSGTAIHQAGPSIILSYLIVGIFCFFMMRALGELILADTSKHSFIDSVKEYLGDRMEFVAGWMYWACWLTLAMADLTATGIYLKYWFPNFPTIVVGLIIAIIVIVLLAVFLDTDLGQAFIATGDNEKMAQSLGINTDNMKILGLMLSNGLIGLAGGLLAQNGARPLRRAIQNDIEDKLSEMLITGEVKGEEAPKRGSPIMMAASPITIVPIPMLTSA